MTGDWAPIHRFCETQQVPCLFPDTPLPVETTIDEGFYTLYLSRGLPVEAATLAHYLTTAAAGATGGSCRCCAAAAWPRARRAT